MAEIPVPVQAQFLIRKYSAFLALGNPSYGSNLSLRQVFSE